MENPTSEAVAGSDGAIEALPPSTRLCFIIVGAEKRDGVASKVAPEGELVRFDCVNHYQIAIVAPGAGISFPAMNWPWFQNMEPINCRALLEPLSCRALLEPLTGLHDSQDVTGLLMTQGNNRIDAHGALGWNESSRGMTPITCTSARSQRSSD